MFFYNGKVFSIRGNQVARMTVCSDESDTVSLAQMSRVTTERKEHQTLMALIKATECSANNTLVNATQTVNVCYC